MWRNPSLVTDDVCRFLRQWLEKKIGVEGLNQPYPLLFSLSVGPEAELGHQVLRRVWRDVVSFSRLPEKDFTAALSQLILDLAQEIEIQRTYRLIPVLYQAVAEVISVNLDLGTVVWYITSSTRVLVGNERRQLFGTRGGRPAWKRLRVPVNRRLSAIEPDILFLYSVEESMDYLDQSDEELMPDPADWFGGLPRSYDWPQVGIEQVYQLQEDAYYRQRYTVNSDGSDVRLRRFDPVRRMVLKVKSPGLSDRNFVDLIARLEVDTTRMNSAHYEFRRGEVKHGIVVFDGQGLTNQSQMIGSDERETQGVTYLAWLVSLIYHDLVTAEEVTGQRRIRRRGLGGSDSEEPFWVYIPRKIRGRQVPPRVPVDTPRYISPHHVSGHLMRGNPTIEHLRVLADFERQTGLSIIDLLQRNPGRTFVRPHISPSEEGVLVYQGLFTLACSEKSIG